MKIISLILIFFITFIISFPKDKIYYFILNSADKYNVQIVNQNKQISLFDIKLNENKIYLSKAYIGTIDEINIKLYNLSISNIVFENTFKDMIPNIDTLNIYPLLNGFLNIKGKFGAVVGDINLMDKKVLLKANITEAIYNKYKNIFKIFKKSKEEKGIYIYEYNF